MCAHLCVLPVELCLVPAVKGILQLLDKVSVCVWVCVCVCVGVCVPCVGKCVFVPAGSPTSDVFDVTSTERVCDDVTGDDVTCDDVTCPELHTVSLLFIF